MKVPNAKECFLDLRKQEHPPLRMGPYALKLRRDSTPEGRASRRLRASVRLCDRVYLELKSELLDVATHRSAEALAARIFRLPYQPYAPVYRQILAIVKAVNVRRNMAGGGEVPLSCVRFRRVLPKHFVQLDEDGIGALEAEIGRAG